MGTLCVQSHPFVFTNPSHPIQSPQPPLPTPNPDSLGEMIDVEQNTIAQEELVQQKYR